MTDLHALATTIRNDANAVSNNSPAIKKTLLAQADLNDAVAAILQPPPPPSSSTRIGNGLLLDAQGNSFGTLTTAQLKPFGGCISGEDKESNFKTLEAFMPTFHGFPYHTPVELGSLDPVWPGFPDVATARANGWILKDQAAAEIMYGSNYIANVGDPSYQAACINIAKTQMVVGVPRFFFDNCDGNVYWGRTPYIAGVAVTDQRFADMLYSFLSAFVTATNAYLVCNVGQGYPDRWSWMKRILPFANICLEGYAGQIEYQAAIDTIQAAGRDPWLIMVDGTTATSAAARQYATAFASKWDRKGGGVGMDNTQLADPNWTQPITG